MMNLKSLLILVAVGIIVAVVIRRFRSLRSAQNQVDASQSAGAAAVSPSATPGNLTPGSTSPPPAKPVADPVRAHNDGMFTAEGYVREFSQHQASAKDGDLFEKIRRRLRSPDFPDIRITIWDFIVETRDHSGKQLPRIPVQMWHEEGKNEGFIKEGHEVALFDPIEPGVIVRPNRIYNVTTNTLVESRTP
jgi:hypothetical protein